MAQKLFYTDSGFQLGEHYIQENSDGELVISQTDHASNSAQKPFMADAGLKIGDWQWFENGNGEPNASTTGNTGSSQFPFIADAGLKIGECWKIYQTEDGDLKVENTCGTGSSSTPSSTPLVGGEGFDPNIAWSSTQWISSADSGTGNPGVRINYHEDIDADWRRVLDNWQAGDQLIAKTPSSVEDLTMTATGVNISDDTSSPPYNTFYFDVTEEPPAGSIYVYLVHHYE